MIHPDYKNGHYHHDIALVILKTPLNYTGEQKKWLEIKIVGDVENMLKLRYQNCM